MSGRRAVLLALFLALPAGAHAQHEHHHHEEGAMRMRMEDNGMVSNENLDQLPLDCQQVGAEVEIVVHAGRDQAKRWNGKAFGYDQAQWRVAPCSKVTVKLINADHIRHQWMIHGLPKYLYPMGMFTLSVTGPGEIRGSFIVPGESKTYLVHCDIPTHTEKGMKAELKVGDGTGDLPSIPGLTAPRYPDHYPLHWTWLATAALAGGALGGYTIARWARR
jgi:hypothetical protein